MHSTQVHRSFRGVADAFRKQLPAGGPGGAALCIYHQGELVLDIWAGTRDRNGTPWTADTLSLSFSTTKGITATLLHILAARGDVDYDAPVARYWPAFAQNGKSAITVRQLLCHEAGLYAIRNMITSAEEMRDWPHMLECMEKAAPAHEPGSTNGYHGLTFGWLVGGLVEKASGKPLAQVLREELSEPLGLDGCFIGVPDSELGRCAQLIAAKMPSARTEGRHDARQRNSNSARRQLKRLPAQAVMGALRMSGFDPDTITQGLAPRGMAQFDWNARETRQACIPGAGGMFNARSLAKIYAALGNDGEFHGARILPHGAVRRMSQIQNTARGHVVPLPMHWRLGYHRVFTTGPRTPNAFGHFGYGGSGAWCDPSRQLAVGYVVNYGVGTPFGDLRMWQINTSAIRAIDSLPTLIRQWLPV
jgi:CubicO group peptidase (beta-lactamase class C family)